MPPAGSARSRADATPKTTVELIYSLLSDTGNTVRTLAMIVVPLVALSCVTHILKLPAEQIMKDVTRHYVAYMVGSFVGGSLLTGGVARAKRSLKRRNGPDSDG